jgi:hypothetical protein
MTNPGNVFAYQIGQFVGGLYKTACITILTIAAGRYLGWW